MTSTEPAPLKIPVSYEVYLPPTHVLYLYMEILNAHFEPPKIRRLAPPKTKDAAILHI